MARHHFPQEYDAVAAALRGAESVCVLTHLRPDADAIGSATALVSALRQLGKRASAFVGQPAEFSANLRTIPGGADVELAQSLPEGFDLYVTVDCGSLDRTGTVAEGLQALDELVCIDHHASNEGFGTINLVDDTCEATTVVLADIFELLDVQLSYDIAHSLYAGLVTDTGSFRWGSTRMHTFAASLMEYGIDTKQIAVELMDSNTADDLQMVGQVLSGLTLVPAGEYTLAVLVGSLDKIAGHSDSAVETLVDFVRALEGSDMGVVFKEQEPGVWATSLRSSTLNCAEIAVSLGGGGHVPAAGYTTYGTPEEITAQLVDTVAAGRFSLI